MGFIPNLTFGTLERDLSPLVDKPEWANIMSEIVVEDPDDKPPEVLYEYCGTYDDVPGKVYLAVIRGGAERLGDADVEFHMGDEPSVRAITPEEHIRPVAGSCLSSFDSFYSVFEATEEAEAITDGGFVFGSVHVPDPDDDGEGENEEVRGE